MPDYDSHHHVVKTTAQWKERAVEYWVVPRGCLCVELTPEHKTKLKVGEGNKYYAQLPYICEGHDLEDYYTKEEIDRLLDNLNRMAIQSTDEYDSKDDLPLDGNKLGDVRFVKSASPEIKIDPDVYLWNGDRWIFVGYDLVEIDLSQYLKKEEFHSYFDPVSEKVDEMYPKMHTHENKSVLDQTERPYTIADKEKLDSLHNYDDTEIRELIEETGHTHWNKNVLDTITPDSLWTVEDRTKFESLHNYDDSELRGRVNTLESKAHTHTNKDVLDQTTAPFTTDDKTKLDSLENYDVFVGTDGRYPGIKGLVPAPSVMDIGKFLSSSGEWELAGINTPFVGATPTTDGVIGLVPAPLMGEQSYYLRGDGSWAKVKSGGDKYKAGEGIYILSGETTADTFPFKLYAKGGYVKQYIIYGAPGGVGDYNSTTGKYHIPVRVSADGHTSILTTIQLDNPLYEGDWVNYENQTYSVYRTDITSQLVAQSFCTGILTNGTIDGQQSYSWNGNPVISDYFELEEGAIYEIQPANTFGLQVDKSYCTNVNVYDENKNRTRTVLRNWSNKVQIIPQVGEKYIRFTGPDQTNDWTKIYKTGSLYRLKSVVSPVTVPLQQIQLIPNTINTIDILTTVKPLDMYVETFVPPDPDPDDPMSEYTGIIYNDGVLDVTQEDPNNLNELTVHFRDNVDKTITIPASELPIASDTTLGGIKVGENLTIDPETGVLDATGGGTTYVEGDGIEFSYPVLETYQVLDKIRKPSGTTLTTDVMPSGTVDFFCDLKYYKYSGNSFLILCYNGESGSFCYTPPVTNSSSSTRMWIYTAHENWYDLYLNDSVQSSNPITVHLRWGTTMSISFDHTTKTAQNSPGVLPGHNLFRFDSSSDADLYWAKFYENSALVGELIPVIRQSDNVVGLFNTVTETFSTASGLTPGTPTGETIVIYDQSSTQNIPINAKLGNGLDFDDNSAIEVQPATTTTIGGVIVGANLSIDENGVLDATGGGTTYEAGVGIDIQQGVSESYHIVEYLESKLSDRIQAINIGYKKTQNLGMLNIQLKWRLINEPTASANVVTSHEPGYAPDTGCIAIGARKGDSGMSYFAPCAIIFTSSGWDGSTSFQYDPNNHDATILRTDVCGWDDDGDISINGEAGPYHIDTGAVWKNIFLFDNVPARIYFCRIIDNDTLVRDLVPCVRDSDNIQGFYDRVGKVFYPNPFAQPTSTDYISGPETGEVVYDFTHESESDPYVITNKGIIDADYDSQNLELTLTKDDSSLTIPVADTVYTAGENIIITGEREVFTKLEYIQGKGNQTINTHKRIRSGHGKFAVDFQFLHEPDSGKNRRHEFIITTEYVGNARPDGSPIIGMARGGSGGSYGTMAGISKGNDGAFSWYWINSSTTTDRTNVNVEYFPNTEIGIDGTVYTPEGWSVINDEELYLFGTSDHKCWAKLYSVKIWDDDVLIFDGIPVKRNSDNEVGIFDKCNNEFFINDLGGGALGFKAGPVESGADPVYGNYVGRTKTISAVSYTLPVASDTTLGGIIVGDGLSVDQYGEMSAKLGNGLQFDANGAIEATASTYTAGTGIQIGGNIIYNRNRNIPSETYRQVEYLASDGTGYILTDIVPTWQTWYQFRYRGSSDNTLPTGAVFGETAIVNGQYRNSQAFFDYYNGELRACELSGDDSAYGFYASNVASQIFQHDMVVNFADGSYNQFSLYTTDYMGDGRFANDSLVQHVGASNTGKGATTQALALFAVNTYDVTNDVRTFENRRGGRFYYLNKMEGGLDDARTTHYLLPCYRIADDTYGVYDIKNQVFYPVNDNAGFAVGNDLVDIVPVEGDVISAKIGKGLSIDQTYGNITNAGVIDVKQSEENPSTLTVKFVGSQKNITIPGSNYVEGDAISIEHPQISSTITHVKWVLLNTRNRSSAGDIIQVGEFELYDADDQLLTYSSISATFGNGGTPTYGTNQYQQTPDKLIDGDTNLKMCCTNFTTSCLGLEITMELMDSIDIRDIKQYRYITAYDMDVRDPVTWDLYVSSDGTDWTLVDRQVDDSTIPTARETSTAYYEITHPTSDDLAIGVKYGNGLRLDANGALEVVPGGGLTAGRGIEIDQTSHINDKLGVGLTFDSNDAVTLDETTDLIFNCDYSE